MEKEGKLNELEPVEFEHMERECTDEEMEYIDLLLKILRSGDDKAVNTLTMIMERIGMNLQS